MFRTAAGRALVRSTPAIKSIPTTTHVAAAAASRRTLFGSAAKARKSGPGPKSFKSAVVRWGLAVGAMYYYLTSSVFADENTYFKSGIPPPQQYPASTVLPEDDDEDDEDTSKPRSHRSLDDIRLHSRTTGAVSDAEDTKLLTATEAGTTQRRGSREELGASEHAVGAATTPEELEEEADQQGAFNPETGEINWDCPCLGGMANGPCGEEFKTAFSCFVYSSAEPKGVDCIDKFKGMQDCFRKYPEHYGAELGPEDDDEDDDELASVAVADTTTIPSNTPSDTKPSVPLSTSQVQEKVRTEVPPAVTAEQETIPTSPESPEQLTTEQVQEKVKREVPPAVESK